MGSRLFICLSAFLLLLVSCGKETNENGNGSGNEQQAAVTISLEVTSVQMTVGEYYQLSATTTGEGVSKEDIYWTSSDDKVITVSSSGQLYATGVGSAIITAKLKNKIATCSVKVRQAE